MCSNCSLTDRSFVNILMHVCGSAGDSDSWGTWHYIACREVPFDELEFAKRSAVNNNANIILNNNKEDDDAPLLIFGATRSGRSLKMTEQGGEPGDGGGGGSSTSINGYNSNEDEEDVDYHGTFTTRFGGLVTNIHLSDLSIEARRSLLQ